MHQVVNPRMAIRGLECQDLSTPTIFCLLTGSVLIQAAKRRTLLPTRLKAFYGRRRKQRDSPLGCMANGAVALLSPARQTVQPIPGATSTELRCARKARHQPPAVSFPTTRSM